MREIKFRAWDTVDKRWIAPERLYIGAYGDLLSYGSYDDTGGFENKLAVQQFTGLHDRNGKEIYEGDVYEFKGSQYTIAWDDAWACFDGINRDEALQSEVIGNIYENPELVRHVKKLNN